jgi:hypothetical protein
LNYGDTEDTELISRDKGDLVPIHDSVIDATGVDPVGESAEVNIQPETDEYPQDVVHDPVLVAMGSESVEPVKVKSQPATWARIRGIFGGGSADTTTRLNHLTQAIDENPDGYVNYVLRAELYMQVREYALAYADFQRGYELSETQFELADWGFFEQAIRDRALAGLEKSQRRLR